MTSFEEMELGEIAYNEYCNHVGWESFRGDNLPKFHDQEKRIKNGWIKAAKAVKDEIERFKKIEENRWCSDLSKEHSEYRIIKNMIMCNNCKDVIESKFRHDFVTCNCGRVSVDGGKDYLKRSFMEPTDFKELSISEEIYK